MGRGETTTVVLGNRHGPSDYLLNIDGYVTSSLLLSAFVSEPCFEVVVATAETYNLPKTESK